MKILDKIGLIIFSTIVLLLAVVLCITVLGVLELDLINDAIELITTDEIGGKITFGISIVLAILALKCIFFSSTSSNEKSSKGGILLQNDNGKLLVSKETIESLANSVVKNFAAAQSVMTRVDVDEQSNLKIFITLFVYPDAVIKDITSQIQKDIKEAIKNSLDLEAKEINVRIKNIADKKEVIKETKKEN